MQTEGADLVRRYLPPQCSKNLGIFTDIMDNVLESGNRTAVAELKKLFHAQTLTVGP